MRTIKSSEKKSSIRKFGKTAEIESRFRFFTDSIFELALIYQYEGRM